MATESRFLARREAGLCGIPGCTRPPKPRPRRKQAAKGPTYSKCAHHLRAVTDWKKRGPQTPRRRGIVSQPVAQPAVAEIPPERPADWPEWAQWPQPPDCPPGKYRQLREYQVVSWANVTIREYEIAAKREARTQTRFNRLDLAEERAARDKQESEDQSVRLMNAYFAHQEKLQMRRMRGD